MPPRPNGQKNKKAASDDPSQTKLAFTKTGSWKALERGAAVVDGGDKAKLQQGPVEVREAQAAAGAPKSQAAGEGKRSALAATLREYADRRPSRRHRSVSRDPCLNAPRQRVQ